MIRNLFSTRAGKLSHGRDGVIMTPKGVLSHSLLSWLCRDRPLTSASMPSMQPPQLLLCMLRQQMRGEGELL